MKNESAPLAHLDPWQSLTELTVLSILESTLNRRLTSLCLPRNSYINRVYELETEDTHERFIVKFYRPGRWSREVILSEHRYLDYLSGHDVSVIPPIKVKDETLFKRDGVCFAIFPKRGGRALDEFDEELWRQVGRLFGRIHAVAAHAPSIDRIQWRPSVATAQHLSVILAQQCMPPDYDQPFVELVRTFITRFDPLFDQIDRIVLHGDAHRGNLMIRPDEGLYLVDFDDMSIGPAMQDIWMLFPDNLAMCPKELGWFRDGYETFCAFPGAQQKLLSALQGMRMVHFVAWSAIQHREAPFQQLWCDWGTSRYWHEIMRELQTLLLIPNAI